MSEWNPFKAGTLAWKLWEGDWSGMTLQQIAQELSVTKEKVSRMILYVREKTGRRIVYAGMRKRRGEKLAPAPWPVYTSHDRMTALRLEAKHRGISYGQLIADPDFTPAEEERAVSAYKERKAALAERNQKRCKGCSYNSYTGCSFHLNGRLRRKDTDGLCLEHTEKKRGRLSVGK